jgi:hypothetical protein
MLLREGPRYINAAFRAHVVVGYIERCLADKPDHGVRKMAATGSAHYEKSLLGSHSYESDDHDHERDKRPRDQIVA